MNTPGGPIVGGPVGAMNNQNNTSLGTQEQLNTYIYDHLLKMKLYDLARQFSQSCPISLSKGKKEMNGDDMDVDSKDDVKRPDDLPTPNIPAHISENSFLLDWWCQFWDIWQTARHKSNNPASQQYVGHTMNNMKARVQQQNTMIGAQPQMMNRQQQQQFAGMQPNGIQNMQKQAIANRNGMAQMAGKMQQNGMPQNMNQMNFAQNVNGEMVAGGPQGVEGSIDMLNQQRMNGQANASQGNHALQDYQMQLMLLEQQNKKRLLMARQEQDNINHVPGTTQPGQLQFAGASAMSPQNGRPGPSPNPNDQMKRQMQNPKMGNMPGSPAMAGDMNRGSPVPGGFEQNGVPPNMPQQMFARQGMMAQGQPPSSHPGGFNLQLPGQQMTAQNMEQMRAMQAARGQMPNGAWQQGGQPMMQPASQQGQIGTPQPRNAMPPPPAPNAEQQRTQPSSPAQPAGGPPTPSQVPKNAPKGKKEAAKKKGSAAAKKDAATPAASDAAPPATPTPSTPITPMHQNSFNKGGANAAGAQPPQQGVMDPNAANAPFADLGGGGEALNLDFSADGPDVLENFDFDSFLHNTDDSGGLGNFDFMHFGVDGAEASAGL